MVRAGDVCDSVCWGGGDGACWGGVIVCVGEVCDGVCWGGV